jgi:hypothetical protein
MPLVLIICFTLYQVHFWHVNLNTQYIPLLNLYGFPCLASLHYALYLVSCNHDFFLCVKLVIFLATELFFEPPDLSLRYLGAFLMRDDRLILASEVILIVIVIVVVAAFTYYFVVVRLSSGMLLVICTVDHVFDMVVLIHLPEVRVKLKHRGCRPVNLQLSHGKSI